MSKTDQSQDRLLRNALKGNGLFSLVSALVAIAGANPLADFIGVEEPLALVILGVGLAAHGGVLWWGSSRANIPRWLAWYAIEGDAGWVIATILVLVVDPWRFTNGGKWLLAGISDIVAVFAILQFIGLRRLRRAGDRAGRPVGPAVRESSV
jgi:hypothetical protein